MAGATIHKPEAASGMRRTLVLAALLSGTFMLLLDTTIVNLALPPITEDLHAGESALQWIVSGYALAFGLFLLPSGWLGDRIGHKSVLILGLAVFTVASLMCGLSGGAAELIVWRVVQGAAAGAVNPSIMAFIRLLYHNNERGRAFAAYGTVAGAATSLGPVLGGLLIEWDLAGLMWRPIFLVNLPIGVAAVTAVALLAPRTATTVRRLDVVGLILVTAAMFALTFPLTQGHEIGWPLWTFVMLAAAPVLMAAFTRWQLHLLRNGRDPLVDVRLFARRSFAAGVGLILAFFAGFVGLMFAVSLYLQIGLGHSTLVAGLILMPFAIGTGAGSIIGNTVVAPRLGRAVLHIGTVTVCLGLGGLMLVLGLVATPPSLGWFVAPFLIAGFGCGMIIGPNANIVLSDVPSDIAGVASGTLSTSQRLGTALGVAAIGVVLFSSLAGADSGSLAVDYTHATMLALACSMAAMILTGLLAFLLPRRSAGKTPGEG
ncbi:MAG: MFS transporter [Stackebrandtia sp.]